MMTPNVKKIISATCTTVLILLTAQIGLCAETSLSLDAALPALPIVAGLTQEIEIRVIAPDLAPGEKIDVRLNAESEWGMLLIGGTPTRSGVVKCVSDIPERISYRWSGAIPISAPVIERITAEISWPKVSADVEFQVGMDLRISDIILPEEVTAGKFNPIDIILHDAFNPNIDVVSILSNAGIQPEVALSIVADSPNNPVAVVSDPVARKFFEGERGSFTDISYPAQKFVSGSLALDLDEHVIWRTSSGRMTGLIPPAIGRYHIEAVLKSNAGGLPIKHWTSPPFEAEGKRPGRDDLPDLIAATLEVMSGIDWSTAARARDEIKPLLTRGETTSAVESLGVYLHMVFSSSPANMFGRYVNALSATGHSMEELVVFLRALVRGYGSHGVLLVTKSGVLSWSATASDKTPLKSEPAGIVYENERFIAIPFEIGGNFTLRINGSNIGDVSLWKIIPLGVNAKKYLKGAWAKEIFVNTQELTPPPQNVKFN
ncbi:MAG: hypothetical protein LBQ58_11905 [Synergistaceae bacterium]|jgi:hypothetical protein|nr:hypothetical protein [Synergistaceae bacterium]